MASNVTQIPGADPIQHFMRNYAYSNTMPALSRGYATDLDKPMFTGPTGGNKKLLVDASTSANHPTDRILFTDSDGSAGTDSGLKYDSANTKLQIESQSSGTLGAQIEAYQNSALPASGDELFKLSVYGEEGTSSDKILYGGFKVQIGAPTDDDAYGIATLESAYGGTLYEVLSAYCYDNEGAGVTADRFVASIGDLSVGAGSPRMQFTVDASEVNVDLQGASKTVFNDVLEHEDYAAITWNASQSDSGTGYGGVALFNSDFSAGANLYMESDDHVELLSQGQITIDAFGGNLDLWSNGTIDINSDVVAFGTSSLFDMGSSQTFIIDIGDGLGNSYFAVRDFGGSDIFKIFENASGNQAEMTGKLTFTGTNNYSIINSSLNFDIQSDFVGLGTFVNLYTPSGNNTELCDLSIFGTGSPGSFTNTEYATFGYNGAIYRISTGAAGTGTARNFAIYPGGTASVFIGGGVNYSQFETDGTLVFNGTATTYEDINIDLSPLQSGGTAPGFAEYGGIRLRSWDTGEEVDGSFELNHSYKLNSTVRWHIHFLTNSTTPSGTDYVRWQIEYWVVDAGGSVSGGTTTINTGDIAVTAALTRYDANFTTTFTHAALGGQVGFKISRITATGDAYTPEVGSLTAGVHIEQDMTGSRGITTK